MRVMHIALGGCFRPPPISYGITEDTGGHIAYVLGAARAQARRADVDGVDVVTRGFDAPELGASYARPVEWIGPDLRLQRLFTPRRDYLDKAALAEHLPALTEAFLDLLAGRARRPDILHAHFADAAVLAEAAAARFGMPWLYTPHSLGRGGMDAARTERERRAIRAASAIICSSRDEAERQVAGYDPDAAGRVHRVAPGPSVPVGRSGAGANRLLAPFLTEPDRPLLLAVARPVTKKNLEGLLTAYAEDPWLRATANLAIVAGLRDGPDSGGTEQRQVIRGLLDGMDRHDLWGYLALPKRHETADIPALYARAAETGGLLVNPAFHEPFGLTLVDAAYHGLPVVATDRGGPVDVVAGIGHGRLVDPTDPRAIAAGCRALLGDPAAYRAARAAAGHVGRVYDWDLWAARVQRIARDALRPAVPARTGRARRLLVSDMDGTLTGSAEGVARVRPWLEGRADLTFILATGRPVGEARRVLAAWDLPDPEVLIASCGTEIWRPGPGGAWRLCPAWATRLSRDWPRAAVAAACGASGLAAQPAHEQRRWKLGYLGDAAAARAIAEELADRDLPARVVASHGRFIDVMPAAAGKAAAMLFEAAARGLDASACIAAGDSGNDRDMLAAAGAAILPSNALPEIADLAGPHLHRSAQPHGAGVAEGLSHLLDRAALAAE